MNPKAGRRAAGDCPDILFETALSDPLVLEYEGIANRLLAELGMSADDVGDIIDYLCSVAIHRPVFFLWRPTLPDPKDDMVLELAVDAGAPVIVTFNTRDFAGAERFGVRVLTPGSTNLVTRRRQIGHEVRLRVGVTLGEPPRPGVVALGG